MSNFAATVKDLLKQSKNIVFDFDGTLADTEKGIIAAEKMMLEEFGLPVTSEAQMRSAIGLPLGKALQVGGNVPEELLDRACERYHELFFICAPKHIRLFDGVRETLDELRARGVRMAIATSRGTDSLNWILDILDLGKYFDTRVTASDVTGHKPLPDSVLLILERMGWDAADTLVVGDTTYDILMGKSAGCSTLGVTYGNHSREKLIAANPTFLSDRFDEILNLIG